MIVRWSGEGRICWTSNPAGIRGKRCLGKYDFRRGATFLLCAHPAPERRPRGTETAGEPKSSRRSRRQPPLRSATAAGRPRGRPKRRAGAAEGTASCDGLRGACQPGAGPEYDGGHGERQPRRDHERDRNGDAVAQERPAVLDDADAGRHEEKGEVAEEAGGRATERSLLDGVGPDEIHALCDQKPDGHQHEPDHRAGHRQAEPAGDTLATELREEQKRKSLEHGEPSSAWLQATLRTRCALLRGDFGLGGGLARTLVASLVKKEGSGAVKAAPFAPRL